MLLMLFSLLMLKISLKRLTMTQVSKIQVKIPNHAIYITNEEVNKLMILRNF